MTSGRFPGPFKLDNNEIKCINVYVVNIIVPRCRGNMLMVRELGRLIVNDVSQKKQLISIYFTQLRQENKDLNVYLVSIYKSVFLLMMS